MLVYILMVLVCGIVVLQSLVYIEEGNTLVVLLLRVVS